MAETWILKKELNFTFNFLTTYNFEHKYWSNKVVIKGKERDFWHTIRNNLYTKPSNDFFQNN